MASRSRSSRSHREQMHLLRQLDAAERRLKRAKDDCEIAIRKVLRAGLQIDQIGPSATRVLELRGNVLHVFGGHPKLDELHSHGIIELDPALAEALHQALCQAEQPNLVYRRAWGDPRGPHNYCTTQYPASAAA